MLPLGGLLQLLRDGVGASGLLATRGIRGEVRDGGMDGDTALSAIRQTLKAQADTLALSLVSAAGGI